MPQTPQKDMNSSELEQRLASTESDVRHLTESVDLMGRSVNDRFDDVATQFRTVLNKLDEYSRQGAITWPLIFTAVGTLVGCATLAGLIHMMSLRPLTDAIGRNRADMQLHESQAGHPEMMVATAVLQEADSKLKIEVDHHQELQEAEQEKIQVQVEGLRELLTAKLKFLEERADRNVDDISSMDMIIQREMGLHVDHLDEMVKSLRDRLLKLERIPLSSEK